MDNKSFSVNPQPTAVIIAQQPQQQVIVAQAGCCCVPETASGHVKATRAASIAILLVHIASLIMLAFVFWMQWIASLLGIIMSSIVLCSFNKCTYGTAAGLYILGAILDVIIVIQRITWVDQFDSVLDDHDAWVVAFFTLPSAIGALTFVIGAAFAIKAVGNWHQAVGNWHQSGAMIGGASPV